MSANSPVTCLRSPSSNVFEARMPSARCFEVWRLGAVPVVDSIARVATASPHAPQNLADGASSARHLAQAAGNAAPHSTQNRELAGLSRRQLGHRMERLGIVSVSIAAIER